MNINVFSVMGLGYFLIYVLLSVLMLSIFTWLYTKVTPYREFAEIKKGEIAPALTLSGAMLGFTFPLLSMSYHGINIVDFVVWSIIAAVIQLVVFAVLYRLIPIYHGSNVQKQFNVASAIVYMVTAICVGLINAISLIPST